MIQSQAEIMARTEVVPKQYRGKPDDVIAAGLMGRELGFGIATSLRLIDVIEGNPELNAEGKLSLIRSRGHSVRQIKLDDSGCVLYGKRCDNGDELEVSFTWGEAERITYDTWEGPKGNKSKVKKRLVDKDNWQNYRQDMLWSRTVSRLGRRLFGDVLQGFSYDRDEIESHILGTDDAIDASATVAEPIPMVRRAPTMPDDGTEYAETVEDTPTDATRVDTPPVSTGGVSMSAAQHRYLEKLLGKEGLADDDRAGRHARVSKILDRPISSLSELTTRDASKVIDTLNPS